jgi:peptide/nickel transport system substrate-binding protein
MRHQWQAACRIFGLAASGAAVKLRPVMIWRFLFVLALVGLASCGKKSGESSTPAAQGPLPEPPLVANCEPGQRGGRLVIATFGEPKTFNPLTANESSSTDIIRFLFSGFMNLEMAKQEATLWMAESYKVEPDQKTWTFKLRKGLRWSDGQPLTADDVIFTWEVIYDPKIKPVVVDALTLAGKKFEVTKVDDLTVRIVTPAVYAPFLEAAGAGVPILPRHKLASAVKEGRFDSAYGVNSKPEEIVGSGPFRLKQYKPGELVLLERNPYFFVTDPKGQRLPYLDHIMWTTVPNYDAMSLRTLRSESDLQDILRQDEAARFEEESKKGKLKLLDLGLQTEPMLLWFNQNTNVNPKTGKSYVTAAKQKLFRNQKFRQAVSYAIDRESIVKSAYAGRGEPAYGVMSTPGNKRWYNPNIAKYPLNPAKAKALLAEIGVQDRNGDGFLEDESGDKIELILNTNAGHPVRHKMAVFIQDDLKRLGFDLTFQPIDFNALVDKVNNSYDYDAMMLVFGGDSTDPANMMNVIKSDGFTHFWFPRQTVPSTEWEARLDKLMIANVTTLDYGERKKAFDEIQAILADQCPAIAITSARGYAAVRSDIGNVKPTVVGSTRVSWNAEELYFKK